MTLNHMRISIKSTPLPKKHLFVSFLLTSILDIDTDITIWCTDHMFTIFSMPIATNARCLRPLGQWYRVTRGEKTVWSRSRSLHYGILFLPPTLPLLRSVTSPTTRPPIDSPLIITNVLPSLQWKWNEMTLLKKLATVVNFRDPWYIYFFCKW